VTWWKHLVDDLGGRRPQWGFAGSPLIAQGKVIVDAGSDRHGTTLALDAKTGELIWGAGRHRAAYASHVLIDYRGRRAVAGMNAHGLLVADLQTGQTRAQMPWRTSFDVNASAPIQIEPGVLFISSGYRTGGGPVDLRGQSPEQVWHSRKIKTKMSGAVILPEGYVVGLDGSNLRSLDLRNGQVQWYLRSVGEGGKVVLVDDKLLVMSQYGEVILLEANGQKLNELARFRALPRQERSFSHAVLAGGRLFCRSNDGDLYAYDVSK
jgi:outer membrane protein assembly factor BamB